MRPKTRAGATVDRLLHHAHVCTTTGDSVVLQQATTGKGWSPWCEPGAVLVSITAQFDGRQRAALMTATVRELLALDKGVAAR